MHLSFKEGFYIGIRVTGPSHNYLAIEFSDQQVERIGIETLDPQGPPYLGPKIDGNEIAVVVLDVLSQLNKELNTDYAVQTIRCYNSDTPYYQNYVLLTAKIIRFMHEREKVRNHVHS